MRVAIEIIFPAFRVPVSFLVNDDRTINGRLMTEIEDVVKELLKETPNAWSRWELLCVRRTPAKLLTHDLRFYYPAAILAELGP